jgi:ATP-dependent protease HslVU (ClpYQ) peptidase subunit
MMLDLVPVEDLLAELVRREAIRILQVEKYIDGAQLMRNLGSQDEVRAMAIAADICVYTNGNLTVERLG